MGLFDQTIDPQNGVMLEPSPALDPLGPSPEMMAAALPPAPMMPPPLQRPIPPQAPSEPGTPQKILAMALLGLAAGLGPRRGNGIAQGLALGQRQNDIERQTKFRNDQLQYQEQEQNHLREAALQAAQARAEAAEQAKREQALQRALMSITAEVKTIPNKAEYDKRIQGYAGILQGSGYRLDANWLRQAVPYVAPSGKAKAEAALQAFFKNPLTQQQLKSDPNAVANGSMTIDLNDDGVAEVVPIRKVMEAAGMSVLSDDKGQPVSLSPGLQGGMPQIKLQTMLDEFKATNRRDPNPTEMKQLIAEAEKLGKDTEMADITKELARHRLSDARNKPAQTGLSDKQQRRVDSYKKGFEALPVVKTVQKMAEAASFAQSLDPNTKNSADDIALLYAFAKAMDPDSVVREGEYATVQRYAQSWAESFKFNTARMFSNTPFLSPEARKNMKTVILSKFNAGRAQYDNVRKSYTDQINKITGQDDGETYLTDFGGAFPNDPKKSALDELRQR